MQQTVRPELPARTGRAWLSPRNYIPALLTLALLALPLALADQPFYLHIAIMCLLFAYWATCWNLVGGYAGALSLGHAAYAGTGAYVSTLLFINLGLSPWLGLLPAGLAAMLIGVAIGYPTLRLRGPYFALATFALCETLRLWLENTTYVGDLKIWGSMGISLPPKGHQPLLFEFGSKVWYYYVILGMTLGAIFITYRLTKSRLGYHLAAIRTSIDAAESLGVNFGRTRLIVFALSAFLTGLGGTFFAQYIRYINPTRLFGFDLTFDMVFVGIVGGRATILGPLMASAILTPWREIAMAHFSGEVNWLGYTLTPRGLHIMLYGALLVAVMLYKPWGIHDPIMRVYERLLARLEGRRRAAAAAGDGDGVAAESPRPGNAN